MYIVKSDFNLAVKRGRKALSEAEKEEAKKRRAENSKRRRNEVIQALTPAQLEIARQKSNEYFRNYYHQKLKVKKQAMEKE
jgi:hypothetical protein